LYKVQTVRDGGAGNVVVQYVSAQDGPTPVELTADHVVFCTGGLQKPRRIDLPKEACFAGDVVYGCGGAPDAIEAGGISLLTACFLLEYPC
jgi:hypothetical protein